MSAYVRTGTTAIEGLEDVRRIDRWAREFAAAFRR
jgi:hypothetical protein